MLRLLICLGVMALLLDAAAVRADPIVLPALRHASAVWGDGQARLYIVHQASAPEAAKGAKPAHVAEVYECRRGTAPRRIEPPAWDLGTGLRMVGTGTGDAVQLVVWDSAGHAGWYRGGKWELTQLPVPQEEHSVTCHGVLPGVGAAFFCVTDQGTVLQWQGETIRRFDPGARREIVSVTATPAGVLYLVDKELGLLRFADGAFEPLKLPKLRREKGDKTGDLPGLWWNARSDELWVGFADRLLIWEVARDRARLRTLAEPLLDREYRIAWHQMQGVQARSGPAIWVSSYKQKILCDSQDCYRIPVPGYMLDGFLSTGDSFFYAATDSGMVAVLMEAAALGNGPGIPIRSRLYRSTIPFLNLGMGPRWPLTEGDVAFALDVVAGFRRGWLGRDHILSPGFWLSPQLGYSYTPGTHLFVGGVGLGFGAELAAVDYTTRLVAGTGPEGGVLGVRHGVSLHFLYDLLAIEAAHQYTGQHDMRLMFSVNPVLLIGGIPFLLVGAVTSLPKWLFGLGKR